MSWEAKTEWIFFTNYYFSTTKSNQWTIEDGVLKAKGATSYALYADNSGLSVEDTGSSDEYKFDFVSDDQIKAVYFANYLEGMGAVYDTEWNTAVSAVNINGTWMAQNTYENTEWCTTVSGLPDGKYTVKASVQQTGDGAVMHIGSSDKVSAQSTVLNGYNPSMNRWNTNTEVDLNVTITDGAFKLWVENMDNAGYVRIRVHNIQYDAASGSAIASPGFWTAETPAEGKYYIYEGVDAPNKYLAQPGKVVYNIKNATLFTLKGTLSNCTVSYDNNGTTNYIYFDKNGVANWGSTPQTLKIIDSGWEYHYRINYRSYDMQLQNKQLVYYKSTWGNWQFISEEQYNSVYPVDMVRTQLDNANANVGRFNISGTALDGNVWVGRCDAVAGNHNLEYAISNLENGIYVVNVLAKTTGSGAAKVVANDGESVAITDQLTSYEVLATVTDGTLNVYIDAEDGTVYSVLESLSRAGTFVPTAISSSTLWKDGKWKEVKTLDDDALKNSNDYFFTIWSDKTTALTLKKGTVALQGTGYNTMSYTSLTDDVLGNLANLWEIYPTTAGKFVFVSASQREYMLQTDDALFSGILDKPYFRFKTSTTGNIADASVAFSVDKLANWNFETKNGYLTQWGSSKDIRVSSDKSDYRLFAISRVDYYKEVEDIIYQSSAFNGVNVPLLLGNPDALGTNGGNELPGWTVKGKGLATDSISVKEANSSYFKAINNRALFEYNSEDKPTGRIQQTLHNLPEGGYQFSVKTLDAAAGAQLFAVCNGDTLDMDMSLSSDAGELSVSFYKENESDDVTLGVDLSSYQKYSSEEGGQTSDNYTLKFDDFSLVFFGNRNALNSAISEGEYYLRTNVGTDDVPEYRYLEAGGESWGTFPVMAEHGFTFKFEKNGHSLTGEQYWSLDTSIAEPGDNSNWNNRYFYSPSAGLYYDQEKDGSQLVFEQVDAETNPLDYRIKIGTMYLATTSDNGIALKGVASRNAQIWQIVNETQRIKEMTNANELNPVDATFFIKDPNFSRNDMRIVNWKVTSGKSMVFGGMDGRKGSATAEGLNGRTEMRDNNVVFNLGQSVWQSSGANNYNMNMQVVGYNNSASSYKFYQTISSGTLPSGVYRITAQGAASSTDGLELFALDGNGNELGSVKFDAYNLKNEDHVSMASYFSYVGNLSKSIDVNVTDGKLTIGFRGKVTSSTPAYFDNVEMYYLGASGCDVTDITEDTELYIYNVDAGLWLSKKTVGANTYSTVSARGEKWVISPSGNKDGMFAIKNSADNTYLMPSGSSTSAQTLVKGTDAYQWSVKTSTGSTICTITDQKGRVLEWTGDGGNLVFAGSAKDLEPRGTRWTLYTQDQYSTYNGTITQASNARKSFWPLMRAARVNQKNFTGDKALTVVDNAYADLESVWASVYATGKDINSRADALRSAFESVMDGSHASVAKPIDVSFYIKNANLGDDTGWSKSQWSTINEAASLTGTTSSIVSVARFYYSATKNASLTQTLSDLPTGIYKVAVDLRTRNNGGCYDLSLASNGKTGAYTNGDVIVKGSSMHTVTSNYVKVEQGNEAVLTLLLKDGSIALDNFKLLYCGDVEASFEINDDATELTLKGNWDFDSNSDASDELKKIIAEKIDSLGAVFVYNDDASINGNINVADFVEGTNILFYTNNDAVTGTTNVVRKDDDGNYTCANFVITDKMTLHVPNEFTAKSVTYSRDNKIRMGSLCLPFAITTKPAGISEFYVPDNVDWDANPDYGKLILQNWPFETMGLPANTPVMYDAEVGTITITEKNAVINKTSDLVRPNAEYEDIVLYGTYKKKYTVGEFGNETDDESNVNADGLCARDCYYVQSSSKLVRGYCYFNVGAFRAFVFRGKSKESNVRPNVLYVDFDAVVDAVETYKADDTEVIGYYDVKGVRYDNAQKGLNIVRYSDGTSRKFFVK
ncbi:MAG: hypothetical protein IJR86_07160 [Bacteroidaceae bacterium]|nr:hypothetical protein [Bacteroidaceae bacterium]